MTLWRELVRLHKMATNYSPPTMYIPLPVTAIPVIGRWDFQSWNKDLDM